MSLYKYNTLIFLNYKSTWFLWESAWSGFRPITSVAWNGVSFRIDDRVYCSDPSDPMYGYGTPKMKELCDMLTKTYEQKLETAIEWKSPAIGKTQWFYDRNVAISPCAPNNIGSWKRLAKGRHNTLRKVLRNKLTRRVL